MRPQATTLKTGEFDAGIIFGNNGEQDYHLILLPDQPTTQLKFSAANEWAKSLDADLPNRREQRLLFVNAKEHFEADWYWSSEQHASNSGYAWYQYFGNGYQYGHNKDDELRARAVRREFI